MTRTREPPHWPEDTGTLILLGVMTALGRIALSIMLGVVALVVWVLQGVGQLLLAGLIMGLEQQPSALSGGRSRGAAPRRQAKRSPPRKRKKTPPGQWRCWRPWP
jgi:hypothetical protein